MVAATVAAAPSITRLTRPGSEAGDEEALAGAISVDGAVEIPGRWMLELAKPLLIHNVAGR